MTVVTRFAPSPTGALHIGGVRTALFNWLYARANGGRFLLRMEDTDRERSTAEAAETILQGLEWLNLHHDGEVVYQSQRSDRYREMIQRLLDKQRAYHCHCTPEELAALRAGQMKRGEKPRYDRRCLHRKGAPPQGVQPVVRFLNDDEGEVQFTDLVHGTLRFSNRELDDLIIARSDGTPTYNFTVVVDDLDMAVTHVIRGDDHVNNTPRQLNILRALEAPLPQYAHLPMIRGTDGRPLSKRHGALSVVEYKHQGYLPEALLNHLLRLGWSCGDREIFSVDEMVDLFDLSAVNKAAAISDPEKLRWLNQHYIKQHTPESLMPAYLECLREQGVEYDPARDPSPLRVIDAWLERAVTLEEMAQNTLWCYRDPDNYDEKAARKQLVPEVAGALLTLHKSLQALGEWKAPAIHDQLTLAASAHDLKFGRVAQALRVALSGGTVSPPIDVTTALFERDTVLRRLDTAMEYIRTQHSD